MTILLLVSLRNPFSFIRARTWTTRRRWRRRRRHHAHYPDGLCCFLILIYNLTGTIATAHSDTHQHDFFQPPQPREVTPVTLALSPREVRIIKCNGNLAKVKKHSVYALHPEYLSQIVVLGKWHNNCWTDNWWNWIWLHFIFILQTIFLIEIVIDVFNVASATKSGCSFKIVYTRWVVSW